MFLGFSSLCFSKVIISFGSYNFIFEVSFKIFVEVLRNCSKEEENKYEGQKVNANKFDNIHNTNKEKATVHPKTSKKSSIFTWKWDCCLFHQQHSTLS